MNCFMVFVEFLKIKVKIAPHVAPLYIYIVSQSLKYIKYIHQITLLCMVLKVRYHGGGRIFLFLCYMFLYEKKVYVPSSRR